MTNRSYVDRATQEATLRWFIISGVAGAVVMSLFSPFTAKFLTRLGGTDLHLSLLSALPGWVGLAVTLPGAIWLSGKRTKNMKTLTAELVLASRLLVLLLIPLVWLAPENAPMLCLLLLALKHIPEAISQTALQGLIGDLFQSDQRVMAITMRSRYSVPATLVVSLTAGFILRAVPGNDMERLTIYQIFFVLSAVFGLIEVMSIGRMRKTEHNPEHSLPTLSSLLHEVFSYRPFLQYLVPSLVFHLGWHLAWPLFSVYQVIHLGADELWLSGISVVNGLGTFIGYKFWNQFIRKHGNGKAAILSSLGMATNPIMMTLFPNLWWVTGVNLLMGLSLSGSLTVLLNTLLSVSPDKNRVVYVGVFNTLTSISLALTPLVSYALIRSIGVTSALYVAGGVRLLGCLAFVFYNRSVKGRPISQSGS